MHNQETVSPFDHFLTSVIINDKLKSSLNKTYEMMAKARDKKLMREVVCVTCRKKHLAKNTRTVPWWQTNSLVCLSCYDRLEDYRLRKAS